MREEGNNAFSKSIEMHPESTVPDLMKIPGLARTFSSGSAAVMGNVGHEFGIASSPYNPLTS